METIIAYYIIIGLSFVITSYITIYRPAMKIVAQDLVDLLNKDERKDFILEKTKKFLSLPYRFMTLLIYSLAVFVMYPMIAIGAVLNNASLVNGFSKGIINGLLELENE